MAASGTWRVTIITVATALLLAGCLRHVQEAAESSSIKDDASPKIGAKIEAQPAKGAKTRVPRTAAAPTKDTAPSVTAVKTASDPTKPPAKMVPEKLTARELSVPARSDPALLPEAKPVLARAPQPNQAEAPPAPRPLTESVVPRVETPQNSPSPAAAKSEPGLAAPPSAPPAAQGGAGTGTTPVAPAQLPSRASLAPPPQLRPPSSDPASKAATGEDRLQTARLVAEGRKLFLDGKVIEARRRFIAALNALSPDATVELARTFDTFYLSKLATSDGAPDMQRAIRLYQTAIERGAKDADSDLARVRAALAGQASPPMGSTPSPAREPKQ